MTSPTSQLHALSAREVLLHIEHLAPSNKEIGGKLVSIDGTTVGVLSRRKGGVGTFPIECYVVRNLESDKLNIVLAFDITRDGDIQVTTQRADFGTQKLLPTLRLADPMPTEDILGLLRKIQSSFDNDLKNTSIKPTSDELIALRAALKGRVLDFAAPVLGIDDAETTVGTVTIFFDASLDGNEIKLSALGQIGPANAYSLDLSEAGLSLLGSDQKQILPKPDRFGRINYEGMDKSLVYKFTYVPQV